MVRVNYLQGLANNLFQYCFGRILSVRLNCALNTDPIPGFENTASYGRLSNHENLEYITGHVVDVNKVINNKSKRLIVVNGYFQRYEYFKPFKDLIKQDWLYLPNQFQFGENDITLHIRSGDIWQANNSGHIHRDYPALPYSFYQNILDSKKWDNIFIVTEFPDEPMVHKLVEQFSAQVQNGNMLEDFNFVKSSKNIVMSVSTFSWWAAWLSDAREIYLPVTGLFDRARRPDVNLLPDDDSRYHFIRIPMKDHWYGTEAERQHLLNS